MEATVDYSFNLKLTRGEQQRFAHAVDLLFDAWTSADSERTVRLVGRLDMDILLEIKNAMVLALEGK